MKPREWFGHAGHFIGSPSCRFHLATLVGGRFLISTVGDYRPSLHGRRRRSIGSERFYETYVFDCGPQPRRCTDPECMCGLPEPLDWMEIDALGYQTAAEAREGHMSMCDKWEMEAAR